MAIEKVGVYRKWLEPVPEKKGKPMPKSEWPKRRRHCWVVRWYGTNRKKYGKLFKTRKEAERYSIGLQNQVRLGKADKPQKITLKEFRLEHEQVMKGQVAYATLYEQKRALKFFEKFIGGSVLLSKIKPLDAEAFIAQRLLTVPSVFTVNKDIRTLRSIFNKAIEPRQYLLEGQNPFAKIKERKTTENRNRYIEIKEYRNLMDKAKNSWWSTFIAIAYGSGLRRNEILNLTWKNIDFENKLIVIVAKKESQGLLAWDPKSRRNRIVPMSDESAQLLADLQLKAEENFPYIFITPQRLKRIRERQKIGTWTPSSQVVNNLDRDFRIIRCKAGVDECVIHDLRRSAINHWAKKLPIHVVQELAGHTSIETTRKYYLSVQQEDLVSANSFLNKIFEQSENQLTQI